MTNTQQPEADGESELSKSERFDYERLKQLEMQGIEDYRAMREAPVLTPEAVVSFISQLSPWNLRTTGVSILEAYVSKHDQARDAQKLDEIEAGRPVVTRTTTLAGSGSVTDCITVLAQYDTVVRAVLGHNKGKDERQD